MRGGDGGSSCFGSKSAPRRSSSRSPSRWSAHRRRRWRERRSRRWVSATGKRYSCGRKDWTTPRLRARSISRWHRLERRSRGRDVGWWKHTKRYRPAARRAQDVEEHMQHLEEGTIHAWLDGALDEEEAGLVARHVAECTSCAAMVAAARGLIAGASRIVSALDIVRGGVIPPSGSGGQPRDQVAPRRRSLWTTLHFTPARAAIAATVLVAVGSLL